MSKHDKLILASQSKARMMLLKNAGLKFKAIPAHLDEDAISKGLKDAKKIAKILAREKALFVARKHPDALVIGADQVLACEGQIFSKARSKPQARKNLLFLRGKTHHLHSAVCVVQNRKILWQHLDTAALVMKNFDEKFLQSYFKAAEQDLTHCAGAYALESSGAWLFEKIKGDYFTILGLPVLPLLTFLQEEGWRP